jgi:hypothetical protein
MSATIWRSDNKQGHHDLRQVGLSYLLDGENGISLCQHGHPGSSLVDRI